MVRFMRPKPSPGLDRIANEWTEEDSKAKSKAREATLVDENNMTKATSKNEGE